MTRACKLEFLSLPHCMLFNVLSIPLRSLLSGTQSSGCTGSNHSKLRLLLKSFFYNLKHKMAMFAQCLISKYSLWWPSYSRGISSISRYKNISAHPYLPSAPAVLGVCDGQQAFLVCYLSFGLFMAPRVFTKVLAPILGLLHSQGIPIVGYLYDLLL